MINLGLIEVFTAVWYKFPFSRDKTLRHWVDRWYQTFREKVGVDTFKHLEFWEKLFSELWAMKMETKRSFESSETGTQWNTVKLQKNGVLNG